MTFSESIKQKFKNIIFKNAGYKLLSFLIAVVLWLYITEEKNYEVSVNIPIIYTGISDNLILTGGVPDATSVKMLGNRTAIYSFLNRKPAFTVDLAGTEPGSILFRLNPEELHPPPFLKITKVNPYELNLLVEKVVSKVVKITPLVIGIPAKGYRVSHTIVNPHSVSVWGAESNINRLQELLTTPVDISGKSQEFEEEVGVDSGKFNIKRIEPEKEIVRVAIVERFVEKIFDDVPVNSNLGARVNISPENVSVRLVGPETIIEKLEKKDIRAYIKLKEASLSKDKANKDSVFRKKVNIEVLQDEEGAEKMKITIIDVKPSYVRVIEK